MEIQQAIEEFLQHAIVEKGLLKETIIDYKEDLKSFLKYFPYIKTTDDLSIDDLDNFIYKQSLDELKSTTISRRVSSIKTFFRFLERDDIS